MLIRVTQIILSLVLASLSVEASAACGIKSVNQPYIKKGSRYFYALELPEKLERKSYTQGYRNLSSFRRYVKHKTSVDPIYLLKKQYEFYKNFPEDRVSYQKILSSKVGKIEVINCIEALLMDAHLSQLKKESEFQAYILDHQKSSEFFVIVNSVEQAYVDRDERSIKTMYKAFKQGWRLYAHLHSHPFSFDNPYGDISGTVIPSKPDIGMYRNLYRRYGLRKAIVTNGFHSLELTPLEFNQF